MPVLTRAAEIAKAARLERWPIVGSLVRNGGRLLNDRAYRDRGMPARVDGQVDVRLSPRGYSGGSYRFDPALTAELLALARPGRHFLDVGAHVGIASLIYSKRAGPETRVCAFEPNPRVFPMLVENSRVNGSVVECLQLALGDEVRQVPFFSHGQDPNASLSSDAPAKYWYWANRAKPVLQECQVTMSTLDAVCGALGVVPGVVKLDVEGAELQVLRGGADVLRQVRPAILLETHVFAWESFGYTRADLEAEIHRLGYAVFDAAGRPFNGSLGIGREPDNNHYLLKPR